MAEPAGQFPGQDGAEVARLKAEAEERRNNPPFRTSVIAVATLLAIAIITTATVICLENFPEAHDIFYISAAGTITVCLIALGILAYNGQLRTPIENEGVA